MHRLVARALRAWLVEHEPAGTAGAIAPRPVPDWVGRYQGSHTALPTS